MRPNFQGPNVSYGFSVRDQEFTLKMHAYSKCMHTNTCIITA